MIPIVEGGRYKLPPGKWIQIYPEGREKPEKTLGPFRVIWRSADENGDCLFMDKHKRRVNYSSNGELSYSSKKKKLAWHFDVRILSQQELMQLLKPPEKFQQLQNISIEILKSLAARQKSGFIFDQNDPSKIIKLEEQSLKRRSVQLLKKYF